MKRVVVWGAAGIAALLAVLQFFPAERTNPPVEWDVDAPDEVRTILRRACYDCHSDETRWPWYSRVAPLSWWIVEHVEHGRSDMNFSRWPTFDFGAQEYVLRSIEVQIEKNEMPLPSYLILHPEARLTEEDRRTLLDWAGEFSRREGSHLEPPRAGNSGGGIATLSTRSASTLPSPPR